jgi:hypothetical protein
MKNTQKIKKNLNKRNKFKILMQMLGFLYVRVESLRFSYKKKNQEIKKKFE